MDVNAYRRFTQTLTANLAQDERVVGLVALGSMAELDYLPDEWSDHDFFVVTKPDVQEAFLADLSWLPDHERIVFVAPEGSHGFRAIFDDGHLVEPVVLDESELAKTRLNRYRILLDRGQIAEQVSAIAALADQESDAVDSGMFLVNLIVGVGRYRRGERLSAQQFVKSYALEHLVRLLVRHVPAERRDLLDNLAPTRRFDFVYPELAAELDAIGNLPPVDAALRMIDLADRVLAPAMSAYPAEAIAVVRRRITS